jgi:hypothetical protein
MDPMTGMAIASVAAPIVGGLVGNLMGSGDRKRQAAMIKRAMAELDAVGQPPDLSREIIFKELQRAGILTPQLEEEITIAESEMGSLKEQDTSLRGTQKEALERIKQQAATGLTAEDRATLNQARSEAQRDANANRQALRQQMQSRGLSGGGNELMMLLQGDQGAADQAAAASDSVMAQAQQRALQALGDSSRLAGEIRNTDFNQDAMRAQARDIVLQNRAQNSVARQSANVGRLNQAQMANLQEQQRIQDANTQMANQEKLRQVNAQGELFDRKLALGTARSNAATGQASAYGGIAKQKQEMGSTIGSGIGTSAASLMGNDKLMEKWRTSDENAKTNIDYTDEDVTIWMDRISKLLKGKK